MLPEEISNYKDQVAKKNNKSDKRTLTDKDLFDNLVPIESNPDFHVYEDTVHVEDESVTESKDGKTILICGGCLLVGYLLNEVGKPVINNYIKPNIMKIRNKIKNKYIRKKEKPES